MDSVILRGHHSSDFWRYLRDRGYGDSHGSIVEKYLDFNRSLHSHGRSDDFEKHLSELFRRIYELEAGYVVLVAELDDICLGPQRKSAREWCSYFTEEECLGKDLLTEDEDSIINLGFVKRVPVPVIEYVNRIREVGDVALVNLMSRPLG